MSKTSQTHPLRIDSVAVSGTTGVIGMTFCPGKVQKNALSGPWERDLDVDLKAIQSWGATALISLMEPHEYKALGVNNMPGRIPPGMQHFQLPMPDAGIPDDEWEENWVQAGQQIRALLIWGRKIVIHCKGGLGRTGLLAARLLVEFGMPAEDAIKAVRKARSGAIENMAQEDYVRRQSPVAGLLLKKPSYPVEPDRASRYRGCLLAGAVGDALGAPVEFIDLAAIRRKFGPDGIRDYVSAYGRIGGITDDTQMTLFTAEGLLRAHVRGSTRGICHPPDVVHHAYLRWLKTQGGTSSIADVGFDGWLFTHQELFCPRAPGTTCIGALRSATRLGEAAKNDSKGCGGVMRVAPAGLFAVSRGETAEETFTLGCDIAALTHGHPSGQLPAGVLAVLIRELVRGGSLREAIVIATPLLRKQKRYEETLAAIEQAESLAASTAPADRCIPQLGQGWVAEEALAIALFCALRAKSLEEGIIMAVNITGDSDSTGAIAGSLLGAMLGVDAIPDRWLGPLELKDVIVDLADDLTTLSKWRLSSGLALTSEDNLFAKHPVPPDAEAENDYWVTRYPG